MSKYNLETISKRFLVGSKKWDEITQFHPEIDEDIIPFSVADMELDTASEIKEGLKKYIEDHVLGYANPTQAFYDAVCRWMTDRHNWVIKPEWILTTSGVISALYSAVNVYTKPGEGVMLMTPVYYPMYNAISVNDRVLVENKLVNNNGHYEIDFEDFEAKVKDPNTKLLILCSPHNPSSRVWTMEELERIGRLCIDNGVLIVSDEIHFDLVMPGYKHIVFANISEEFAQHSIICTAPSKTFNLAGLQTSSIIIPNEELRKAFRDHQLKEEANPKSNVLGYEANRIAYTECDAWLDKVNELIYKNNQIVEAFMEREFPQVKITKMEGTYLLWMDFNPLGIEYKELAKLLRIEAKLFFDDGYIFGEQGEGFERWNLACPTRYIQEGLERLKVVLNKRLG
nr:MalY/PatB family protein [uncultured Clostridium sp.]